MPSDAPGEPTATIVGATGPQTREYYLDLLDARELADAWTTAADVAATKPAPDLVEVAIRKTGLEQAVMIGDSIWDCQAAARAGIQTIAVLTGGFSEQELGEAGALRVFGDAGLRRVWFTQMIQSALVAIITDAYSQFGAHALAALEMLADQTGIELADGDRQAISGQMRRLPPAPPRPRARCRRCAPA